MAKILKNLQTTTQINPSDGTIVSVKATMLIGSDELPSALEVVEVDVELTEDELEAAEGISTSRIAALKTSQGIN